MGKIIIYYIGFIQNDELTFKHMIRKKIILIFIYLFIIVVDVI